VLVAVAAGMRFWSLGERTLHYDELLHAYFTWIFSDGGGGYSHTPVTHGPFLFHLGYLSNLILGSSDTVARLAPALFGTALVAMLALLRKEMGRIGAFMAGLLLTVSPSILYFSRFMRNDIYMAVWMLGLVIIMWRYMERPRFGLLVAWAALWALSFATKESSFINAGIMGFALFIMALPDIARWVQGRIPLAHFSSPAVLLLVLVTLTAPLFTPALGLVQRFLGIVLVNRDPSDPMAETLRIASVETGAPAGGGLYVAVFIVIALFALMVAVGLSWNWRRWLLLIVVFMAIWVPLHTTFFTNGEGFFTGLWGSLGYWITQQPVERAGQPWYFYILLTANYEFLIAVTALAGSAFLLWRGCLFDRFLIYWALTTFLAFTYAGEKMPWLQVGITLPMALVAGRSIGSLIAWLPWPLIQLRYFGAVGAAGALLLFSGVLLLLLVVNESGFLGARWFWLALLGTILPIAVAVVISTGYRWSRLGDLALARISQGAEWSGGRITLSGMSLGGLVLLLGMTVFVAGRASYTDFQEPSELLVYSQTGQETAAINQRISNIAEASGKGTEGLRVLVGQSDSFGWQWKWYLRDYAQIDERFLNNDRLTGPPDADIVLINKAVEGRSVQKLEGFTRVGEFSYLWWFPNAAFDGITPGTLASDLTSREGWQAALDYFFNRNFETNMHRSLGVMYVADEYASIE
jgi:uncharacterized protein (TIGR03663 family)